MHWRGAVLSSGAWLAICRDHQRMGVQLHLTSMPVVCASCRAAHTRTRALAKLLSDVHHRRNEHLDALKVMIQFAEETAACRGHDDPETLEAVGELAASMRETASSMEEDVTDSLCPVVRQPLLSFDSLVLNHAGWAHLYEATMRLVMPHTQCLKRETIQATFALRLNYMGLRTTPPHLSSLTSLYQLELKSNRLTTLPAAVCELTQLRKLVISYNSLNALPIELQRLGLLTSLDCSDNLIHTLPTDVAFYRGLHSLQKLVLTSNHLKALPEELCEAENLTYIGAGVNAIARLPRSFGRLKQLRSIGLTANKLETLPDTIGEQMANTSLNLGANQLRQLPPSLCQMRSLKELRLTGNRLTSLPPEIEPQCQAHPR